MVTEVAHGDGLSYVTTFEPVGEIIRDVIGYPVI